MLVSCGGSSDTFVGLGFLSRACLFDVIGTNGSSGTTGSPPAPEACVGRSAYAFEVRRGPAADSVEADGDDDDEAALEALLVCFFRVLLLARLASLP